MFDSSCQAGEAPSPNRNLAPLESGPADSTSDPPSPERGPSAPKSNLVDLKRDPSTRHCDSSASKPEPSARE